MKKIFLLLLGLIYLQLLRSQTSVLFETIDVSTLSNEPKVWTVDNIENLIVVEGNVVNKYDSTGKRTFTQSVKFLGEISKIEPINTLKLLVFSEEQQCICVLDNTLSINGKCKYLDEFGIRNATVVATSNRPNLIWVFDQFNSSLYLIDIIQSKVIQLVENFSGISKMKSEVKAIQEYNNHLFLSDQSGLYEFDMMLNWVNYYEIPGISSFQLWKNVVLFPHEGQLKMSFMQINRNGSNEIPTFHTNSIAFQGNLLYLQVGKRIEKIKLKSLNE